MTIWSKCVSIWYELERKKKLILFTLVGITTQSIFYSMYVGCWMLDSRCINKSNLVRIEELYSALSLLDSCLFSFSIVFRNVDCGLWKWKCLWISKWSQLKCNVNCCANKSCRFVTKNQKRKKKTCTHHKWNHSVKWTFFRRTKLEIRPSFWNGICFTQDTIL